MSSSPPGQQPPNPWASTAAPPQPARPSPTPVDVPAPKRPRLAGIDIARGLAIIGMFAAHLGDDTESGADDPAWLMIFDGRSAALFAFLAGVSLALSTGRQHPPTGAALVRARLKIFYRALLLVLLGVVLIAMGTPVVVILPAYGLMFVLTLPFLGGDRVTVLLGAGITAIISPIVIFALTTPLDHGERSIVGAWLDVEDPVHWTYEIAATGYYPALIFCAYILVGLAVGRSTLTSTSFQACMVAVGSALAALAWGSSRLLLEYDVGQASPLVDRLIRGGPHEYSPVEIVGSCGTSLAVTGLLLLITRPGAVGRVVAAVLSPLGAAGAMSLTVYSLHIVVIALLGDDVVWYPESNAVLIGFVVVSLAASWAWRRWIGTGPLEQLLKVVVSAAVGERR
ncbi:heparan-alpha-glucosaminide N-acetyltransferase domain-containing protein [Georgenia alba]|uniref:Heparan-alpha-glucosaminide N-acetyltransferase domain-containing protein n=1 Tax=Georgenia alba TaxID=2233858 RepID=A0ABW2QBZ9_9MICO